MSKISEFTEKAVREYLRTVVLIDDKAFESAGRDNSDGPATNQSSVERTSAENGDDASDLSGIETIPSQGDADMVPSSGATAEAQHTEDSTAESTGESASFNPQGVVSGFAAEGIVCGLYSPQSMNVPVDVTCNEFKKLEKLCANSDVFILDWLLNPHDRESPVPQLLQKLIAASDGEGAPKPIRFCAIYTREVPSAIFSKLCESLEVTYPGLLQNKDVTKLSLQIKGIGIVVYGKESLNAGDHYIPSAKLASKIIGDFAQSHEGILPASALKGIAAVRNNTNRLLRKFPSGLDFALLVHAGLTIADPNVAEDIAVLVTDEIRSIISDANPAGADVYSLLAEKMESVNEAFFADLATDPVLVKPETTAAVIKAFFVGLFEKESRRETCPLKGCEARDSKPSKALLTALQKIVEKVAASTAYKACDLSKLFCQRTIYSSERILRPGTIVRDTRNKYYVCMMPLCDSLRLGAKRAVQFPFWRLTPADAHTAGKAHGVVVADEDGHPQTLCLKGKIKDRLSILSFKPDEVVKFVKTGDHFVIKEQSSQVEYAWIAELKPVHAQRMAEYVSREFSRVGLTESEWLRQQVDR